ncbi:type II toxin-antitoxin system HicA family toxin [Candidatus Poribacteria bacterium]|nr:type II toxin-antitoxin system HicA family toxin [Candidatus Poribacteria bacterium]
MKRLNLEKHMEKHGCYFIREGGKHSIWGSPHSTRQPGVPRHRNIPRGTVRKICKELNIPDPFNKN